MSVAPADDPSAAAAPAVAAGSPPMAPASPRVVMGPVAIVVVTLVNAWLAVAAYHFLILPSQLPRIGVVDLLAIYRDKEAAFTRLIGKEGATDRDREAAMAGATEFARGLPLALDALSADCRCVILAGNAVAGRHTAIDLSPELRRRLGL